MTHKYLCLALIATFTSGASFASACDKHKSSNTDAMKIESTAPVYENSKDPTVVNNKNFDNEEHKGPYSRYAKPKQDGDNSAADLNRMMLQSLSNQAN